MRHYDPWVFGMLWEIEHREELRRQDSARLARHMPSSKVAPSSASGAPCGRSHWTRPISSLAGGAWLRLHRSHAKTS